MKEFLVKRFKGRGIGFYIGLASAVLMLVFSIVYIAVDSSDRTFSILTFALALVGAVIWIAYTLLDFKFLDFLPILSCACYGVAFAQHLRLGLETLSDVWNGVNFVGGNPTMAITFIVLFGIGMITALVAAFMKEDKSATTAARNSV